MQRMQKTADRLVEEAARTKPEDREDVEFPQRWMWRRLFLDSLAAGPSGRRIVHCPTVVGNAYLTLTMDLYQIAELEERLRRNPTWGWAAQTAFTRTWYALNKEVRSELQENSASGVALLRLAVIAAVLAAIYIGQVLTPGGMLLRDLAYAGVNVLVSWVSYSAGFAELISLLSTARALFMTLDRDTVQDLKKDIEKILADQPPPPPLPQKMSDEA